MRSLPPTIRKKLIQRQTSPGTRRIIRAHPMLIPRGVRRERPATTPIRPAAAMPPTVRGVTLPALRALGADSLLLLLLLNNGQRSGRILPPGPHPLKPGHRPGTGSTEQR